MQMAQYWDAAQVYEADHWQRFIENCKKGGERHWLELWAPQAELIIQALIVADRLALNTKILEIGGGAIGHARWFPVGELVGIDPLGPIFEGAFDELDLGDYNLRYDMMYIGDRAEEMPREISNHFDVVLLLNTLDHTGSPLRVMSEINRVIKDDGWLFESTTVFNNAAARKDREYTKMHPHVFVGEASILKFIESCGFLQVDVPMVQEWVGESGPHYDQKLHVWGKA